MLAQQEKNPGALAARLRGILAFGADHPYGWPAQGFPGPSSAHATAARRLPRGALPAGQLADHVRRPISLKDATALARQHFGAWTGGAAAAVSLPAPTPAPGGRLYLYDRQDAAQTVIMQDRTRPSARSPTTRRW